MPPHLFRKMGLAMVTALALLALMSWASFHSLKDARQTSEQIHRVRELQTQLQTLVADVMTAESESRAYYATREVDHLDQYHATLPRIQQHRAALQALSSVNAEIREELLALDEMIAKRLDLLNEGAELARSKPLQAEKRRALIQAGSELREGIRGLRRELMAKQEAQLAAEMAEAEASASWANRIILGSNLIAGVCLILAALSFWRDYAALRHAEMQVRDREVRLRIILDHMAEGMLTLDGQGAIQSFNPAARRMFGYAAGEVIGQNISFLIPDFGKPDQHRLLSDRGRASEGPGTPQPEGRRKNGTLFPLELSIGQFFLIEGRYFTIIVRDVTERQQVAQRLLDSEEKYRLLFERNPLPFWLIDTESQAFLDVNRAAVEHYGFSREEWLNLRVRDIRPAEDVADFETRYARGHSQPEKPGPHQVGISRHCKKDGSVILVDITVEDVVLQGRNVHFCLGLDVTERVHAEDALRREKAFVDSLIETAPAIVLVLDLTGRILRINNYLEELTGHTRKEVEGRDWFTTFLPERDRSRLRQEYTQAAHQPSPQPTVRGYTSPILTRAGRERWIQWSSTWLRDDRGTLQGILALGHDTTELRQSQERALQAERLAAIGQMVTGLAHESRNALQRSISCLEMLSWEVRDRPRATELIGRVQKAQTHLQHLYEEVRGYAAPIRPRWEPCRLESLVREAWEDLANVREGRDAELLWDDQNGEAHCEADPIGLTQVLRNILENALAACTDPTRITVESSEGSLEDRPAVRLTIRDNGPGMSPDVREMIFEPFFTTKTKGTGLGMAISKRIIEAHHGRLAAGQNGSGAEIVITLPMHGPWPPGNPP